MKPTLYFFLLGLAVGVGGASWFWYAKSENDCTERVSAAVEERTATLESTLDTYRRECPRK